MTRYLYGDSSPSPLDHDFLGALEVFVPNAVAAIRLQRELDRMVEKIEVDAKARTHALGKLERFHRELMKIIEEATSQTHEAEVISYGRQLMELAVATVERHRSQAIQAVEGARAQVAAERTRRADAVQQVVGQFLAKVRLPDEAWKVKYVFKGAGCEMSALVTHPGEIVVGYALRPESLAEWQGPRKIADFVHDLDLRVGLRKSLFSSKVQPEVAHLDEYVVSAFVADGSSAEFRLRKKVDAEDSYVLAVARRDDTLLGQITRTGTEGPESKGPLTEHADRDRLERLRLAVLNHVAPALAYKGAVLSVSLGGKDVFENGLAVPLTERIVEMMAPAMREIAKRSPNPAELSLKREDDSGRREEIYCSKQKLVDDLRELDEVGRQVFASFGLLAPADLTGEGRSVDVSVDD